MATKAAPRVTPSESEPYYGNPNPLYGFTLVTVILCSSLTTIFTAARLVTKRLTAKYGIEDFLLFGAWFSWTLEILYAPTIWLAKASLIFQLIRIFTPMKSGAVYWACHTLIWVNLAFYISVVFLLLFECHPIKDAWSAYYAGHCIDRSLALVFSAAVNVFSDLLNLLLPIWAIWHLQMAPKRRFGITAIFATGFLGLVASIVRLIYCIHLLYNDDVTYILAQIGLWTLAEFASIILCTCFPMMPRLAKLVVDRRARSKSSTRTLWKRAKSGNSESGELGDVHHPRPSEEGVTRLDGRSEASQQNWNPIKA